MSVLYSSFTVSIAILQSSGSPGPFDKTIPAGLHSSIFSFDESCGYMYTVQSRFVSSFIIFPLHPKSKRAILVSPSP